ncbi:MAG: Vi polysaccharide biosynthesis protein VipB/TviC [Gemmatimonadetes bacterium]|nr:Vi polysaccharide biosynthesis protein VipB/TviC [Gemmatimonadota bacterium]
MRRDFIGVLPSNVTIMTGTPTQSAYESTRAQLRAAPRVWLVTGAAGFIGSNIVQELLELDQTVVGLDNFSTGHQANLDEAVAATADTRGSFRFIEGDIRDLAACQDACAGVDYVLHQAALASVPRSIADPVSSSQVNVDGFLNVLVAARDAAARRVVYASSSSVYGDATTIPQVEHITGQILSPYAATKATNELYASVFERTYGLQTVGLRYFNVFGRRQDPNGAYAAVIPRWVANLLKNAPCEIYGDGETSRDFCYVANAVQANILGATVQRADATAQAYNIACGSETSLNALFGMIRDGLVPFQPSLKDAQPQHEAARQGDIRRSLANISKAGQLLGYQPTHGAAAGLVEALHWYAAQLVPSLYPE